MAEPGLNPELYDAEDPFFDPEEKSEDNPLGIPESAPVQQRGIMERRSESAINKLNQVVQKSQKARGVFQDKRPEERPTQDLDPSQDPFVPEFDPITFNMSTLPVTETLPNPETGEPNRIQDTVNFLFGPEMGILGIKWDEQGLRQSTDIMMQQWSESPILSSLALAGFVASVVFPVGGLITKSAKVGKLARAGVKVPGVKALVAPGTRRADDIRLLMNRQVQDGHVFFQDDLMERLVKAAGSDDKLEEMVGNKMLNKILLGEHHRKKFLELEQLVSSDTITGPASRAAVMKYGAWKMFGNSYFMRNQGVSKSYLDGLNDFYQKAGFGRFFEDIPDPKFGEAIYKFRTGALSTSDFNKLPANVQRWTKSLSDEATNLQQKMLETGFIDDVTFKHVGPEHVPAFKKGTVGVSENLMDKDTMLYIKRNGDEIKVETQRIPSLGGPQLKYRQSTREEVQKALTEGKLITDPTSLLVGGYIKDAQLLHSYSFIRDLMINGQIQGSKWTHFVKPADEVEALSKHAQRMWIDMEKVEKYIPGAAERIKRMILKVDPNFDVTKLPRVHTRVFDELFGPEGMMSTAERSVNLMEILTAIHKTSRTAFNPSTHVMNLTGTVFGFLPMAGYNVMTRTHLSDGKILSKAFGKIAKQTKDEDIVNIMSPANLRKIFGKDDIIKTDFGGKVRLSDEFGREEVRQLIEDSAFEHVEGLKHVEKIFEGLQNGSVTGSISAKKVSEIFSKVSKVRGIDRTMRKASSLYLGEDVVPKMMYYVDLLRQGYGRDAAIMEVGRRLPQYKTVGRSISNARRWLLPWITFPSETARILKNNIIDHPLQMLPFLSIPGITQSLAAAAGLAPTAPEAAEAMKSVPAWAHKPSAVLLQGEQTSGLLGGLTGGVLGGTLGTIKGGAPGALIGATLGAAALGASSMAFDQEADDIRSWLLDWLPHSSIMPATTLHEPRTAQDLIDISPLEPFSVLKPMIDVMMGKGAFGREIPVEGPGQAVAKAALGMAGFLSPPIVQKYGMNLSAPDGSFLPTSEFLGKDIEVSGTPSAVATGLGTAGLVGYATKSPLLAAATGALGALAGSQINTKRLMVDLGIESNPRTGQAGNPVYDLLFNSFAGLPKSWKADPKQRLFNEAIRDRNFSEVRSYHIKNIRSSLESGRPEAARAPMQKIFNSFLMQYLDPAKAQQKFEEYIARHIREFKRLPMLRGISEARLRDKLREASAWASRTRSKHARDLVRTLQAEIVVRGLDAQKEGGIYVTKRKDRGGRIYD